MSRVDVLLKKTRPTVKKVVKIIMEVDKMTDEFSKFYEWMTPLKNGYRSIKADAPKEIKEEAKRLNEEYFKRTGRYMLQIDY